MRDAICDSITSAIPRPDSAVVQAKGGEQRCLASRQNVHRIFIWLSDHDGTKARDLIVQQFNYGLPHPLAAKTDTRPLTTCKFGATARIRRMLEERKPCLVPQPVTE